MKVLSKARALPIYTICGTDFKVDVIYKEFREVAIPYNIISFMEIGLSEQQGIEIAFDTNTRKLYTDFIDPGNIPERVQLVVIPLLDQLLLECIEVERHTKIIKRGDHL